MHSMINSDEAIDLLGGTRKVMTKFKRVNRSTVANWRSRGFPAQAYAVLAPLLRRRKVAFDPYALFNMLEPADGGQHGVGTGNEG